MQVAAYGYTTFETVLGVVGGIVVILALLVKVSSMAAGIVDAFRNQTPSSAIENVNALHVDEVRFYGDPLGPRNDYAAVSEVREHMRRGRR